MSTKDLCHVLTAMQTDKIYIITMVVVVVLLILIVINVVLGLEKKKRAKDKRFSDTAQDIPEINITARVSINYSKLTASPDDITDDMTIEELRAYIDEKLIQGEFRVLEGSIDEDGSEYISADDAERATESDTFKFVVSDDITASEDRDETDLEVLKFETDNTENSAENISATVPEEEVTTEPEVLKFETDSTDDSTENISAAVSEEEVTTEPEVLSFETDNTEDSAENISAAVPAEEVTTDLEVLKFETDKTDDSAENISAAVPEEEVTTELEVLRFEADSTDDSAENISAAVPEEEVTTEPEVLRFETDNTEDSAENISAAVPEEEVTTDLEVLRFETDNTEDSAENISATVPAEEVNTEPEVLRFEADSTDDSAENISAAVPEEEVTTDLEVLRFETYNTENSAENISATVPEGETQLAESVDEPTAPNISPLLNTNIETTENYFTYNTLPEAAPVNEQNNFDLDTQEYDYTTKSLSELSKIEESAESTVENADDTGSDKILTVEELYAARKSEAAYAVPSFSEFISQQKGYGHTDSTEDEFSKYFDGLNDGSANADGIVEDTSAWDIKETKSLSSFLQKSAEDGIDLKRMIEEREYGAEEKRKKKRLGLFSRQEQAAEEEEYIDEIDDSILLNDTGFIIKKDKNEVIENLTAEITSQYEQADLWSDPSAAPSARTEDLASGFIKSEEDDLFFDMPKASFGNDNTATSVNISDWAESASNQIISNISVPEINIEKAEEQLEQTMAEDDVIDPFLMYKSVFEDTDTLPTADTSSDDELAGVSDMADPFLMYKSAFAQSSEEKIDEPEVSAAVADENSDTAEPEHSTTDVINTDTQPATPYIPQSGGEAVDDIDIGALAASFGITMDTQTSNFAFMQSTGSAVPNPYTSGQANKAGGAYAQYAGRPNPYMPAQSTANPYGQYSGRPNPYMPNLGYTANPYAQYAGRPNPYMPTQGVGKAYAQYAGRPNPYTAWQSYTPTSNAQPQTQPNTNGTQQNTEKTTQS